MRKDQGPGTEKADVSFLEKRLVVLGALYHRYGLGGLKDQPTAEVGLLLSAKELLLRDSVQGGTLGEEQQAASRRLALEVKDLTAYLGQRAGLSLADLRSSRRADRPQQQGQQRQFKPKNRAHGIER